MARNKKGNFVDTSATVESDGQAGMFSVPGAQIIEIEQESWFSIIFGWVKNVLVFGLLAVAVLAVLYSGLSSTIMVFSPVGDTGRQIVLRGAWADSGGIPPIGTPVAVSPTTAPSNWWEWIPVGWVGIPDASEVEIVSTDYAKLYVSGADSKNLTVVNLDNEAVNGKFISTTAVPVDKDDKNIEFNHGLKDQFLVKCVSGGCTPGTYFVVQDNQIYGEIR